MSGFYERLVIERAQLYDKVVKLVAFLKTESFNKLDQQMQDLLKSQLEVMYDYLQILTKRIKLIDYKDN